MHANIFRLAVCGLVFCGLALRGLAFGADAPPLGGEHAPKLVAIEQRLATLEAKLAALEAKCQCGDAAKTPVALDVVLPAKQHPIAKAAANIVTAPAKVLRSVCSGGSCRLVEVDADPAIQVYSSPVTVGYGGVVSGGCASGNCGTLMQVGMPSFEGGGGCSNGSCMTQRRGLFGRRR